MTQPDHSIFGNFSATTAVPRRGAYLSGIFTAVLLGAAVLVGGASVAQASSPLHCPLPHDGFAAGDGLARTVGKLQRGEPVTVVAIGSSSTEGVGASSRYVNYPAWFGRALVHVFPASDVTVYNRGIGGQRAAEQLARFERDVLALAPDLVLWQTGTIEAMEHVALRAFIATLEQGIATLRGRGIDVMLVDPQHSPKLEAQFPAYHAYVGAMRAVARTHNVAMLDRYSAMRRWGATASGGAVALMSSDNLHMKDDSYRCFGAAAAAVVACAAGRECPTP